MARSPAQCRVERLTSGNSSLAFLARKRQCYLCPSAQSAFCAGRSAMQFHDRLYDGQPEARAGGPRTARRIPPIETIEDPRQMFGPDTAPIILHRDLHLVVEVGNH